MHPHLHHDSGGTDILHNQIHTQQQQQSNQSNINSMSNINIPETNQQQQQTLSWSCEICGRMFTTRDEWQNHARNHQNVRMTSE